MRKVWHRCEVNVSFKFTVWFGLQKSTRDIIADASAAPLWQLILSVVLVSAYGFLAFLNIREPVHSHTMLALVVNFATLLSL